VEPLEDRCLLAVGWPPDASMVPAAPDSDDAVAITLGSVWGRGCTPSISLEKIDGQAIHIGVYDAFTMSMCTTVLTPWSDTETLDPLPAGDYTVFASLYRNTLEFPRVEYRLAEGPKEVAEFKVWPARPVPPTELQVAPASDTGASSTDGITNDYAPRINWRASADPNVVGYVVTFDNETFEVTETSWAWPYRCPCMEGTHEILVQAKYASGQLGAPASYEFTVDYTGPSVVAHEPSGTIPDPVDHVLVTFSEPIDEKTFTKEDVHVRADSLRLYIPVTGVVPVGEETYRIEFDGPELRIDYHVEITPGVADVAGNLMDQDRDGDPGESLEDMYDATYVVAPEPAIRGRHVFYNHSAFDGDDPAASDADDAAVATDKAALLPGEKAGFANYTSFALGINGVMIDVDGLPQDRTPTADDFRFRVGDGVSFGNWTDAPATSAITVRRGDGVDGSDRVSVVWPDYAIRNGWLEVTLLAGEGTHLPEDDVFYFGNAVGEAGNLAENSQVTTTDVLLARNNPRNFLDPAGVDFAMDYNRDGRVNTTDVLLARNNQTSFLTALELVAHAGPASEESAEVAEAVDLLLATYGG